jgi:uncharacterized protein YuzE
MDALLEMDYDRENDSLFLYAPKPILALSLPVRTLDLGKALIDIGDLDNIRAIELFNASKIFKTTKSILNQQKQFGVSYGLGKNGKNVISVGSKELGMIRIEWCAEVAA